MSRPHFSLIVAIVCLVLALAEFVMPFGSPLLRSHPMLLLIVALLAGARYASVAQARKRKSILDAVPKHPLGLSGE